MQDSAAGHAGTCMQGYYQPPFEGLMEAHNVRSPARDLRSDSSW